MRSSEVKRRRPRVLEGKAPSPVGTRGRTPEPLWVQGDPETVRPLQRGEGMPVFVAGVFLALLALFICYRAGYTLLYGDAVAHLGNARRVLDAHYPGLSQLGGAWLPLPHLLMLPFIGNMAMWQTGLAAAPMSMISFAASAVGVWRLSRRLMRLRWAVVATLFYALNPNLLYLATTAMTEALFLALFVWSVVATVEFRAAARAGDAFVARARLILGGIICLLMVLTRYDGWVVTAVVGCCFAWALWRGQAALRRRLMPAFAVFTVLCAAGAVFWFWYNAHFDGDWLDFLRGPYSAAQIERRTAPPGQHYRGWHNPLWSMVFYLRTAQIDAAFWESGWVLMAGALYGLWVSWGGTHLHRGEAAAKIGHPEVARGERLASLLWVPLPFYVYSIAFGSVPIFLPQLWPHAFYNTRYGMEMLPALSVYGALAGERGEVWLRTGAAPWQRWAARYWQRTASALCALNAVLMIYGFGAHLPAFLKPKPGNGEAARYQQAAAFDPQSRRYALPLVLQEGVINARTRVPFEHSLANVLETVPVNEPVLMSVSAHVGAVQDAGRPLKSVISEDDEIAWRRALADPAHAAAYVVALEGDPVALAVKAHPAGLAEVEVVRTVGQPAARVYQSTSYKP